MEEGGRSKKAYASLLLYYFTTYFKAYASLLLYYLLYYLGLFTTLLLYYLPGSV